MASANNSTESRPQGEKSLRPMCQSLVTASVAAFHTFQRTLVLWCQRDTQERGAHAILVRVRPEADLKHLSAYLLKEESTKFVNQELYEAFQRLEVELSHGDELFGEEDADAGENSKNKMFDIETYLLRDVRQKTKGMFKPEDDDLFDNLEKQNDMICVIVILGKIAQPGTAKLIIATTEKKKEEIAAPLPPSKPKKKKGKKRR